MTLEAYSVAVRLALNDMVTPALTIIGHGLRTIQRDATGAQRSIADLERRLLSIKNMGLVGGALAGLGSAGLSLFDAPLKAAREYELAFTRFKTLNLGDAVNKQADQFARSANLMGISAKDLMNTLSESVGLFGGFDPAKRMAPRIAELNAANSAIFHGKIGAIDEGSARSLMKFIDRRGGTHDEQTFMRNLDLAQKMVTGSGGFIKFRDLDQFSQMGGTAFRGLSDEGILSMALLLQEQGGARSGTGWMSAYQNWVSGRTTKVAAHNMVDLGLARMVEKSIGTVGGKPQTRSHMELDPAFAELYQRHPVLAIQSMVIPRITAKYGSGDDVILRVLNDLLSARTGSGQAGIVGTQQLQILRDANLTKNAMGYEATLKAWGKDPNSKVADLSARWSDTLRELGLTVLPAAIKGVEGLTGALKYAIDLSKEFPNLTTAVMLTGAALSGLAATGGALMLFRAGLAGLSIALGTGAGAGLVGAVALATVGVGALAASLYELYRVNHREGVVLTPEAKLMLQDPETRKALGENHDFEHRFMRKLKPIDTSGGLTLGMNLSREFDPVATPRREFATIHNKIMMPNGRVLAEVVTQEQAREANRPQLAAGAFDGRLSLGPAGGW